MKRRDEYFTISLHREIRIQDKLMYKPHTNICQSVSSMNLHPIVLKFPSPLSGKCIFLNYSSQGIEAPRSFKFFISAQLQTVDLVKGTQFWGVGIAAGRSWQDFQSRGTSRFFITAKQRNKSRSIKIRNKRGWVAGWEWNHHWGRPQEGARGLDMSGKHILEQQPGDWWRPR